MQYWKSQCQSQYQDLNIENLNDSLILICFLQNSLAFPRFEVIYLHAPGGDLPDEREGVGVRVGQVNVLQLYHHLQGHQLYMTVFLWYII